MSRATPFALVGAAALALGAGVLIRLGAESQGGGPTDPAAANLGLAGTVLGEPWERPSFTLTTTEGTPFDFAEQTAGRLTLLFFGYTSCPDKCPIHLATLAGALEQPMMPNPIVVFVGIDPARDTPAAVRAFLDRFDTDFIGLVGTEDELVAAQVASRVPVAITEPADAEGDYLVGHASHIIVYTPDDRAHVVYPFPTRRQDWVNDLPRLLEIDWDAHAR